MRSRLWNDAGGVNLVKLFYIMVLVAAGYGVWVYGPEYWEYQSLKRHVRVAMNMAYAQPRCDAVVVPRVLKGFREEKVRDRFIGADGTVIWEDTPVGYQNVECDILKGPPPSIHVRVFWEKRIVLPLFDKERTLSWEYEHTEDLSPIEY